VGQSKNGTNVVSVGYFPWAAAFPLKPSSEVLDLYGVLRIQASHPGDAEVTLTNLESFFSDLSTLVFKNPKLATTHAGGCLSVKNSIGRGETRTRNESGLPLA
jgi:hypothetical protein